MSDKILRLVFVILFVVLVGEIGYLFFSSLPIRGGESLDNLPSPTLATEQTDSSLLPERDGSQAISDDMLNVLSHANKGVNVSSILKSQYQGEISTLVFQDGVKITIKAENGVTNTIHFFEKELEKVSITQEGLILNDLKVGNKIMIDMSLNLLEENLTNNLIEAKISIN